MNYWLHRISQHSELAYPLLERGYISIGFSCLSNEEFLEEVLKGDKSWSYFDKKCLEASGVRKRTRYSLWRFIAEFKIGDIVLVPSWGNFSLYEIVERAVLPSSIDIKGLKDTDNHEIYIKNGLFYREGQHGEEKVDIGFLVRVKPIITNISRYGHADPALRSRMKIRQTNANISDLEQSISNAIQSGQDTIYSKVIEQMILPLYSVINSELDDTKIDQLITWYFKKIGATEIKKLPVNEFGKADYADGDICATFEPIRTVIYAQVRHHQYETSDWALQQVYNYRHQKNIIDDEYTYIPWVVSTVYDFDENTKLQAKVAGVRLINGREFARMLIDAGINRIDDAFDSHLISDNSI